MKKIALSWEQAAMLAKTLQPRSVEPVGPHLTNAEFIAYDMETLTPDEQARIEAHLDTCEECSERMDLLVTASEEWRSREGRERLRHMKARILAQEPGFWQRLQEWLDETFALPAMAMPNLRLVPAGAAGDAWQGGELADGILYWRVETLPSSEMHIHVGSFVLPEGTRLQISAGVWKEDAVLQRIAADQVGVSVSLSAETRQILGDDAALRIQISDGPSGVR